MSYFDTSALISRSRQSVGYASSRVVMQQEARPERRRTHSLYESRNVRESDFQTLGLWCPRSERFASRSSKHGL